MTPDVGLQSLVDQLDALEREIADAHPRKQKRSFTASLGILILALGTGPYTGWGQDLLALSVILVLALVARPLVKSRTLERQRATLLARLDFHESGIAGGGESEVSSRRIGER